VRGRLTEAQRRYEQAGDRGAVERFVITFAQLGCPYQQRRTGMLAAGPD
jgi:hypothetical protein